MCEPTHGSGSPRRWRPRTPAMAAGLTDHVWTTDELLSSRVPALFVDQLDHLPQKVAFSRPYSGTAWSFTDFAHSEVVDIVVGRSRAAAGGGSRWHEAAPVPCRSARCEADSQSYIPWLSRSLALVQRP